MPDIASQCGHNMLSLPANLELYGLTFCLKSLDPCEQLSFASFVCFVPPFVMIAKLEMLTCHWLLEPLQAAAAMAAS